MSKWNESRFPILLVHPIRAFKSYVGGFKQVKLNVSTYISFVSVDAAVMIRQFHIFFHVVEVRYACLGLDMSGQHLLTHRGHAVYIRNNMCFVKRSNRSQELVQSPLSVPSCNGSPLPPDTPLFYMATRD